MTTPPASSSPLKLLPTGGCNYNFPNLDKNTTCGCQRFLLGKKKKKTKTKTKPLHKALSRSAEPAVGKEAVAQDGCEAGRTARGNAHDRIHDDAHGLHKDVGRGCGDGDGNGDNDDDDDGGGGGGDGDDDDDNEDVCRCGHHSCYHSGHPSPEPRSSAVRLQDPLELQRASYVSSSAAGASRQSGTSTVVDNAAAAASTAIVRTDRSSANPTALSGISGTTTERDSSTSGTPRMMIKPPWTTKTAAQGPDHPRHHHHPHPPHLHSHPHSQPYPHHQAGRGNNTKQMSGQLQTALGVERLQMSPVVLERPLSVSSNTSMNDRAYKEKFRKLVEYTNALSSNQMSHRERLEMMEVVPQALEELADKVELMDDHVNEKVDSCETRLKNELDDRLAPIESFLKAHQARGEKRKRRHHSSRPAQVAQAAQAAPPGALLVSEAPEHSSSIRHDRKRRRRHDERDASEMFNAQPPPHGITTTSFTTTSFTTTTTSSFSSPAATSRHLPEHVTGLKVFSELEMLKSRLADIESVAPPTVARPWVVEVVLVPPGLPGIWAEPGASAPNTQYTGSEPPSSSAQAQAAQAAQAGPAPYYRSQSGSQQQQQQQRPARTGPVPFSFSPKSKVYKRLHSRGFIKRLHITGPSAREVSFTIETNFADLFEWLASFSLSRASSRCLSQRGSRADGSPPLPLPLAPPPVPPPSISSSQRTARGGTRNLWQPLRKIYRQAALEFLPSCERSAPALWTVDFLKANCMMRGTTRKPLYIIPRPSASVSSALTWDDIRLLDRPYEPDSEPDVGESDDEEEAYWRFDPKLDAKPLYADNHNNPNAGNDNNGNGNGTNNYDDGNGNGNNYNSSKGGGGGGNGGGNSGGNSGGNGGGGNFFSDPFGSFGPFPAEGDSLDATPAKLPSFSSRLASPPRQEATPPDTVPHLQPRQSSKLNRAHTPVGGPSELNDGPKDPAPVRPPKKKSPPKSVHSAAPAAARPSPPSPPHSHPPPAAPSATQSRRRKAVSKEQPHQASREHAAPPADRVPRPSGTQQQWPARSFEALETFGVGSWRDAGSITRQQWSGASGPAAEAESPDWGSLFGTPPPADSALAGAAEAAEQVEGQEAEGPAEAEAEVEVEAEVGAEVEVEAEVEAEESDEVQAAGLPVEDQVEGDEDGASAVLPPPLPVGDSIVDYNGDGGYHSD